MRRRTVLAGSGRGSETQVGSRVGTVLATSCFRDVALLESLHGTKEASWANAYSSFFFPC